jgi:hypothetical protein
MSETESIREQSAAADARSHERRHLQAERFAKKVGRLEQRAMDRGHERLDALEGNVPAELAPRLLALEKDVGDHDKELGFLGEGRAFQAGTIESHSKRLESLEKSWLARQAREQERAFAGEEPLAAETSKRLESLELNAAGYEKQLGRLASLESMHRPFEGYPQGHDAEHRVAGALEQEREFSEALTDGERPEAVEGLTRAQIAERLLILASEIQALRRLL